MSDVDDKQMDMSDAAIQETVITIRGRLNLASPGPWRWSDWEQNLTTDPPEAEDLSRNAVLEFDEPEDEGGGFGDVLPYDGSSPWHADNEPDGFLRYIPNAYLIANAPTDLARLLAIIEHHQRYIAKLEALAHDVSAMRDEFWEPCPSCHVQGTTALHKDDCVILRARRLNV